MLTINKLRVEILTDKSVNINDLFGFEFEFNQGLNIIAGPNSRGKTTINTCIFYALGMEELLGAHNDKALDKALKEEFIIKSDSTDEKGTNFKVISSKVLLEVENKNKKIVCLERFVKTNAQDQKTSNITVYHTSLLHFQKNDVGEADIFYTNARGNNDNPNGFYFWLSEFIDLEIPEVSNSSTTQNYSPLYLQTIFSALFIEQTKGWSDFFATMPFFGITKAKEKIVEFLLNLNAIVISTEKDVLNKERNSIEAEWKNKTKAISYLEKQSDSTIINIPNDLTTDKSEIERITALFSVSEDEKINISQYLEQKQIDLKELDEKPFSNIQGNRESTILEFQTQKEEYHKLKEHITQFENNLISERQQSTNLQRQLTSIEKEIKEHINLKKVFNKKILNKRTSTKCPTCTQNISTNLISSREIHIPQLTLEENTSFLKSQKIMVQTSLESLAQTLDEKEVLLTYYRNTLRQKEQVIKSLSKDLVADDRAFSETEIVKKIQVESEIENLIKFNESISELKDELEQLANKFHNNEIKRIALGGSEVEDEAKLRDFEVMYKNLLFAFGYDSNLKYQISVNRKEPFRYFPVYKNHANDQTPQSIRINSSASDFVRNIWAYTLALLLEGRNHPGVIIFDEPGQHRTNLDSLKKLFKSCSSIKQRQIIIFTSVDKPLNNELDEKLDLDILISDLAEDDYHLIELDDFHKVIRHLN